MTASAFSRPLVVVIDDNDPFLELMRDILESEDYPVITGSVAADALSLIRAHCPALVIIDLVMQTQEAGLAVLRAMRMHPDTLHTPVLLMTANLPFVRRRAYEVLALDAEVMAKPFLIDELLSRVTALIPVSV